MIFFHCNGRCMHDFTYKIRQNVVPFDRILYVFFSFESLLGKLVYFYVLATFLVISNQFTTLHFNFLKSKMVDPRWPTWMRWCYVLHWTKITKRNGYRLLSILQRKCFLFSSSCTFIVNVLPSAHAIASQKAKVQRDLYKKNSCSKECYIVLT